VNPAEGEFSQRNYPFHFQLYLLLHAFIHNALVAMAISFIGLIPLGVTNLTSVRVSLERGFRAAVIFALGCASIELLYSTIAVRLTQFLLESDTLQIALQSVSAGLFLVVGILLITLKTKHRALPPKTNSYYLGLAVSLVNLASVPFWLVYTTFLTGKGWIRIDEASRLLGFIAGVPVGTVLALALYAALGERLNRRFDLQRLPVNRVIGVVLICLSVYGAVRIFWN
jgi:threonine/homoserine/homoserine lactone efflux protein